MSYSAVQVGVTGPSGRIGSGTEFHIDTKFSRDLDWDGIRDRFDALANRYQQDGRIIEFSNDGVAGTVYDLNASPEERAALLQRAAAAHSHSVHEDFHSLDYYAPLSGKNRFDSSVEGAPIYVVGASGRSIEGGTGGGYGNYGLVIGENGQVLSKSGHGDTQGFKYSGGKIGDSSSTPSSPATPQVKAKEKAKSYKEMSKAQLDSAYDAMRNDPNKAAVEGMKMHKAYFNK